ncbi:MAG: E3 ubiquitin ligase family protein [Deltaproteobacteria bacterium]|nr:E3 ubiquitin ligase family protein [Kofleriaceae bacterium]
MEALVVLAVVAGVAIVAASLVWNEKARIRRELRGAPRVDIADLREGRTGRVVGRVGEGETLQAPFTGRSCVFYEATVEEYRSSGKTGSWRQVVREAVGVPFVLDDGTGRAIVDPRGARVAVDIDMTTRSGTFDDATPVEEQFLTRHGLRSTGWVFNKSFRYREGVIEIGETIAVMGQGVREPDPDAVGKVGGYRSGPPTRLRLGGSARHPILLSDAPDTLR